MSIGLMIDYLMHILLRYYDSKGTRRQRVQATMSTLGASVFLGAASTFLGVMPLALSTSEVLQNIFVTVVGLISFGVLNGLVFLPIVLALVGPQ
jgi:predicted RND superfamily exporter protein